jgi:hypothetical protein
VTDPALHIRWIKRVEDKPELVLEAVEEMFEALAMMPRDIYGVRRWPTIEREGDFESKKRWAIISCRFSHVEKAPELPGLLGFNTPETA